MKTIKQKNNLVKRSNGSGSMNGGKEHVLRKIFTLNGVRDLFSSELWAISLSVDQGTWERYITQIRLKLDH